MTISGKVEKWKTGSACHVLGMDFYFWLLLVNKLGTGIKQTVEKSLLSQRLEYSKGNYIETI